LRLVAERPLVVACHDVSARAGADCSADASVDRGSHDPAGGPITCVASPLGPYALGTTEVTLSCSRPDGDSGSCSGKVTVADHSRPALLCPTQQTLECAGDAAVDDFTPQASDNCSTPTVVCDPEPGTAVAEGRTRGRCTATDAAGNTAACAWNVDVRDTMPPLVTETNADADGYSVTLPDDGKTHEFSLSDCVTSVVDRCDGTLDVREVGRILRVTSDERDGCRDAVITSDATASLRGIARASGNGRVYTIDYEVVDNAGNATNGSCRVEVPVAENVPAVADADAYCVGTGCGRTPGEPKTCGGLHVPVPDHHWHFGH
jgi:hypothetical protein